MSLSMILTPNSNLYDGLHLLKVSVAIKMSLVQASEPGNERQYVLPFCE